MDKKTIIICITALMMLSFISCNRVKENLNNNYEIKTFVYFKKADDCLKKDSSMCPHISITYDQFTNGPNKEFLNKMLISYLINDSEGKNKKIKIHTKEYFDTLSKRFFMELKENNENYSSAVPNLWYELKINALYSKFITINVSNGWFYGNSQAHPNGYEALITLSLETGEKVTAEEIFVSGFEERLNKALNQKLKKNLGLNENDRLSKNSYIEFDTIKFNGNFNFSNDTLVFVYNTYEIACYAAGPTTIRISATELKDIIKEDVYKSLISKK